MAKREGADASERVVNLALYLAAHAQYVTASDILNAVEGYDREADKDTFLRMFEHDKDMLRESGFTILTAPVEDQEGYKIDANTSFASELELAPHEAAAIRTIGPIILGDSSFPFTDDLRLALAKIAGALGGADSYADVHGTVVEPPRPDRLSDATSVARSADVEKIVSPWKDALSRKKTVSFHYTNSSGEQAHRRVQPYGMFQFNATWYMVGYDTDKMDIRTFNSTRARDASVDTHKPKSPDYEIPATFRISDYRRLPFQYGPEEIEATLLFMREVAWQAAQLTRGSGDLVQQEDGSVLWRVKVRSLLRLLRWSIANGPGIVVVSPPEAAQLLATLLEKVEVAHG